jgi:hypothetical protein
MFLGVAALLANQGTSEESLWPPVVVFERLSGDSDGVSQELTVTSQPLCLFVAMHDVEQDSLNVL